MKERDRGFGVSWFGKKDAFIAGFAVPVIILLIIFVRKKIFPFGEQSFMRTDMYHQYAPFFSEFKYKLANSGSLLYSWDIGLGVNFSSLYAYYLASPLNWFVILCPQKYIIEFMTYLIVLKTGLCGLSMTYYLSKHSTRPRAGAAFFGIFYALSGYMAAYSWNIMWLDCIILFPVICLGIEKLIEEKKYFLYTVSMAVCIASNYYISIMICGFAVIYFFMMLILVKGKKIKERLSAFAAFAFHSVIAGGLAAVIILPAVYALKGTASGDFNFPETFSSYFSFIDMLARHIGNVESETGLEHWPNIYCSVAVYIMVLLYIANRKIELKEKVIYIIMLIFMLASFSVNVLNYIWHGFHYPNSLPARQSFIYIFLVLFVSYRAYDRLRGNTLSDIGKAVLISIGFILLCQELVTDEGFHFAVYYGAMFFTAMYGLLLYIYKKRVNVNIMLFALLGIVSVEAALNTAITSVSTTNRTKYIEGDSDTRALLSELDDEDFVRFDKTSRNTKDVGAWLNFHSVSIFSSTASADLSGLFKDLGAEGSVNAYSINGATPLLDMLFAVKYGIYTGKSDNTRLEPVSNRNETYLYKNPYALPLAYMADAGLEENWLLKLNSPADVQNDFAREFGEGELLEEIQSFSSGNKLTFTPEKQGEYYVYARNSKIKKVTFVKEGEGSRNFDNVNRKYLLELGTLKAGEEITLTAEKEEDNLEGTVYYFNYDVLGRIYEKLSKYPMKINTFSDTLIEGEVDAGKAGILMTSIPYDRGWSIEVDGKEQTPRKIMGAFTGLDISEGRHIIKMSYMPEGLIQGMIISAASFLIFILSVFIRMLLKKKRAVKLQTETEENTETEESI